MSLLPEIYDRAAVEQALRVIQIKVDNLFNQNNMHQGNTQQITATTSVNPTTEWLQADATAAAITVTLPPITQRRQVDVSKMETGGNSVTIDTPDSTTINGQTTAVLIGGARATLHLSSDGAEWTAV